MSRRALLAALRLLLPALLGTGAAAVEPTSRTGLVAFQRVAVPEDVPAHLASALAQDATGFLWIGTQGGLVRWDGLDWRVFRADPADPGALGGAYVRAILPARDGTLWVGTFSGGLSRLDGATERFTRWQQEAPGRPGLSYDRVEALAEDRAGRVWVGTSGGLDRIDPKSGAVAHFRHRDGAANGLASDRVRALLVDRAGTLWVGSGGGLQRWRGEAAGFESVALPGAKGGQEFVSRLYEDRRGRLWIGTPEHGGAVYDPATRALTRLLPRPESPDGLSHYWVNGFAEVGEREMWVATFGMGVDVVDTETLRVVDRLRRDATLDDTIPSDRAGAVLTDRSGTAWVATWGDGLARHDPGTRAFRALRFSPARPDGLSYPSAVRSLARRDGTIWVGTNGNGIDVLDRSLRRVGGFRPAPGRPGALADGSITCLEEDAEGSLWVATLDGSLSRLRAGTTRFERLTAADGLPGGPIRAIHFGRDGLVRAGSSQGLATVDPRTLKVSARTRWPGAGAASLAVESLAQTEDGTLWAGTDNGLYAFAPGAAEPVRIAHEERGDALPASWVPDLMVARDGRLWAGTAGGAAILEAWDGHAARFATLAGLLHRPMAAAEALIEDREGNVWVGPHLRVDPRTWNAREFGPADGCAFRSFFIASRARTAEGLLLFGSPDGLLVVDPAAIRPWTFAPPVVATALQVDGAPRPGAPLLRSLTLAPGSRGFRLEFAALDLTAPLKNRYRYRLEPYERAFTEATASQHAAAYTHLPPGRYRLVVEGSNRAGVFSPTPLVLAVRQLPAFHQTLWFLSLVALALGFAAYGGYRLRVRQLRARARDLERTVAVRTTELAERNRELAAAYRRIEEASLTDPLTGLRNRRFLEQVIGSDLEVARRGGEDLVFLLLDLDHFKAVNDTHGHAAGDAVLVQLAGVLRGALRTSDHVVRWGGEEFLVVVRFVDRATAPEIAEKLRAAIAGHRFLLPEGPHLGKTASIGFSSWPLARGAAGAAPWERAVEMADLALYAAKRSGRDAWVGVEVAGSDPAASVARFRDDPAGAEESGLVRVAASARVASALRWS